MSHLVSTIGAGAKMVSGASRFYEAVNVRRVKSMLFIPSVDRGSMSAFDRFQVGRKVVPGSPMSRIRRLFRTRTFSSPK